MSLTCPGPIYNAPAFLGTGPIYNAPAFLGAGPIYNAPAFLGAGPIYIAPAFLGALIVSRYTVSRHRHRTIPNTNTQRNTEDEMNSPLITAE
jgi:hypothetical protein